MINLCYQKIKNNEATFILIKDDEIVYQDSGIGVSVIRKLLGTNPAIFEDSIIVDKIIGKAAAMLLIPNNVKEVHSLVMSTSAIKILNEYNIKNSTLEKVDMIINRTNTGMCPLENSVKDINNFDDAKIKIEETIAFLMSNK